MQRLRGCDRRSAPASAYRLRRRIASATPCVANTSVRDLMAKSGSARASAGSANLLHHFVGGDHFLAAHVATAFRPNLVFEHQTSDTGTLERTHGVIRIERVAVTGVAVGEQQQVRTRRDRPGGGHVFVEPHETDIGLAQPCFADAAAGDERRRVALPADQSCTEAVEHSGKHQNFRCLDQRAQARSGTRHGISSSLIWVGTARRFGAWANAGRA